MTNYLKIIAFFISFQSFCCFGQSVTYNAENSFIANSAIKPLVPTITNGPLTGYSFKADLLPPGLYIDQSTGLIWGMPTIEAKETEYTVTAIKDTKTISAKFKVTVKPAAPSITYIIPNKFTVDTKIADIFPNNTGGTATYSVTPPLPDGLQLNPNTGAITGTPTKAAEEAEYTISASNETGTSQPPFKVKIAVKEADGTFSWAAVLCVIAVFSICLYILYFLFTSVSKVGKVEKQALGLPSGSVRAIIAVLFIVFFMLLAVIFYFDADNNSHNTDLAKQILTILGTLVTAVSAFYFGSKATEQGHAIAAEAFKESLDQAGNIDKSQPDNSKPLLNSLSVDGQYKVVQSYIDKNAILLKSKYPQITGIMAGLIPHTKVKTIGVILQVENVATDSQGIPPIINDDDYSFPVSFQQAGITKPHSTLQYLDSGVSRKNDKVYGTFGIPVLFNHEPHILSCFHVYFNDQVKAGIKSATSTSQIPDRELVSPCFADRVNDQDEIVGSAVEGEISDFLDVAIMKPTVNFERGFKNMPGPRPYTVLSRDQENKIYLRFWGNGSKNTRDGLLVNIYAGQWIHYDGIKSCYIQGLIQITKCAVDGDSGAAVCDSSGNLIGIVVASDSNFTYIISAYNIQDKSNYTININ